MTEESIFAAAVELESVTDRSNFLLGACGDDAALRARIECLLAAHEQAGDFLDPVFVAEQTRLLAQAPGEATTLPGSTDRSPAEDVLALLRPSTRTDSLGRIAHYDVLEVLGSGGFGTVLRAFDERLHRAVALKVLAPQLSASGSARARFLREGRSAAAIRDDHVVNVHAVSDELSPFPYLVMELIVGRTLQQKIDQHGPLPLKEVLRIGLQVARGLAAAHSTGLIHRDIKPANILLENGVERVKITDFGLARAADDASMSQSGVVAGTPMFMSPEQARGESLDARSDLFSLGSVIYTMCAGRPPFRAESAMAVLKRVCDEEPRSIREINPEVPIWMEDVVHKLHAKRPDDRFQSAVEVADLLANYLSQLEQQGTVVAPRLREARSRPFPWALLIVVAVTGCVPLTVLIGLAVWFFGPLQSSIERDNGSGPVPVVAIDLKAPFDAETARDQQQAWANQLNLPVEVENSIGMKLRLIPPGEFAMGMTDSELESMEKQLASLPGITNYDRFAVSSSGPRHTVRITKPFFMAKYETTVAQYRAFIDDSGHKPTGRIDWVGFVTPGMEDRQPVLGVSWFDAIAFCQWLNNKTGRVYDLPTEAEWEYAARAGTTDRWSFGNDPDRLVDFAVVQQATPTCGMIGLKKPNPFGLFDMHGNVDEWCSDWHEFDYFRRSPINDPHAVERPINPTAGRVSRGGAWSAAGWWSQSAVRAFDNPTSPNLAKGFRIVERVR